MFQKSFQVIGSFLIPNFKKHEEFQMSMKYNVLSDDVFRVFSLIHILMVIMDSSSYCELNDSILICSVR